LGLPIPYRGLQGLCGGTGPPPSARTPVTFLAFDGFTSQMIPRVMSKTGTKMGNKLRQPPNNPNTIPTKPPTAPTTMPTAAPMSPTIMPMIAMFALLVLGAGFWGPVAWFWFFLSP
jgi:hypothetical protein